LAFHVSFVSVPSPATTVVVWSMSQALPAWPGRQSHDFGSA
jgi:hypothetical protein